MMLYAEAFDEAYDRCRENECERLVHRLLDFSMIMLGVLS
jgi:hypothetical protein